LLPAGRRLTRGRPGAVALTAVALPTRPLRALTLRAKPLPATSAGSAARPSSALIVRPTATLARLRSGACLQPSRCILRAGTTSRVAGRLGLTARPRLLPAELRVQVVARREAGWLSLWVSARSRPVRALASRSSSSRPSASRVPAVAAWLSRLRVG